MLELFKVAGRIDLEGGDKANKELDGLGKKADGLGSKFGNFAGKVGKAGLVVGGAMAGAGAAVGALAVPMVKAAAEAEAMTAQFTQVFGDIGKSAQKTVNELGDNFGMVPNRIKPSFTQMTSMFKGLGLDTKEAMGEAEKAVSLTADAAAFYDKSFEEANGALNSFIKGNYEGGESIGLFANETQLAAWASKELGKDWQSLDEAGKQVTRLEYAKAMQEAAGATGQASRESDGFQNVMGNLKQSWTDLMVKFGQPLLEPVIGWIQKLTEWLGQVNFKPMIDGFSILVDGVATGVQTLTGWIGNVIDMFKSWRTNNEEVISSIQEKFGQVVTFLQVSWANIRAFWEENSAAIMENAMRIFQSIKETVQVNFEAVRSVIEQIIGYVVPFIQEQLARIQAFWAENGEQIMAAVENAFSIIQSVVETVMPIITAVIESAWAIISSAFDAAVGIIMGIVKTFASLLTGDFEGIKEGLTQIWESLWEGIKGIVSGAWSLLSGAFSALWSEISGWFGGLKDDALDWGANMIDGFIDGIKSMAGAVGKAASNVVQEAGDFIKFWSPAKKGEGRYIRHWGRNMIDGFLDGVRDEEDSAGKAMENVVKRMNPGSVEFDAKANLEENKMNGPRFINEKSLGAIHTLGDIGSKTHSTSAGGEGNLIKVMKQMLLNQQEQLSVQQQQLSTLLAGQTIEMSAREVARTIYRPIQEFGEKDTINKMRAKGLS